MISTASSRVTPRMSEDCERVTVAESALMAGILFLMRGQDTNDLAAFLAAEFRVEPDFLAFAAFPEPFGGVVAHVVFKIHAGGPHGVDGLAGEGGRQARR